MDSLATAIQLKAGQQYCISFWYYFLEIDMYSYFGLYAAKTNEAWYSPSNDPKYTTLWQTTKTEARNWNQKYVEIAPMRNDFYLVFAASLSVNSITGLDDVQLTRGTCQVANNDYCDFELNTCDWTLETNPKNVKWTRARSSTAWPDHTYGSQNGHYLHLVNTFGTASATKKLSTLPVYQNSSDTSLKPFCFRLFYFMDSQTNFAGTKVKDESLGLKISLVGTPIYRFISGQSVVDQAMLLKWDMFTFNINARPQNSIRIEGTIGKKDSRIMVDDMGITEGYCQDNGNCDFERGEDSS